MIVRNSLLNDKDSYIYQDTEYFKMSMYSMLLANFVTINLRDKMILDITAIRDYQNTDNLQKLAMNINMENVILLLDNSPETDTKSYLSKLISLGIYNFTKNADGINYLLVHPHTYRDVVNIHNISDIDSMQPQGAPQSTSPAPQFVPMSAGIDTTPTGSGRMR